MQELDLNKVDPRLLARMADHVGSMSGGGGDVGVGGQFPTRGPIAMPMAMPGPGGGGGYNRYREMTLEEMLLENRVIFLVGEINHVSAARVYMQMLYLQSVKNLSTTNAATSALTFSQPLPSGTTFVSMWVSNTARRSTVRPVPRSCSDNSNETL